MTPPILPRQLREEIERANAIEHLGHTGQALRRIEEKIDLLLQYEAERRSAPRRFLRRRD